MNRTIRDILFFGAGVSVGVCVMHTLFQKKYQNYYDERYETERRHLQEREADMEKEIEEKATQKSFEQLAGKYRTESDPEVNADTSQSRSPSRMISAGMMSTRPVSSLTTAMESLSSTARTLPLTMTLSRI